MSSRLFRAALAVVAALVAPLALGACGDNIPANITIDPAPAWADAIGEMVALAPDPGLSIGTGGDFQIAVTEDPTIPSEGYALDAAGHDRFTVRASDLLGAQYGTAAALENLGFRFRHPYDTYVPFAPGDHGNAHGDVHQPQIRVRGLQVHTLHPIESYFAFWEPSEDNTRDAHRIINWVIENRGNFLQWVALDNILDPAQYPTWKAFTQELIAYAHARGIRVGIGIELFGKSNLQLAFDLVDKDPTQVPVAQQIAARLPLLTQDLPFDVYALSYGEFFDSDPQSFIDATNEATRQIHALAPTAEVHADVHVGATQRVMYMGQDLIYYFLVKYCDPSIVPDIHTVMYYDLFEDAGGAYHSTDFSEHRQYLLDRMNAHQPAAYFPEDAYWVAFDDSVPMFLPLYVHSRWLDMSMLRQTAAPGAPLDEHLAFSSGWEWGYWLNDVASLRASYELPDAPGKLIADAYAPGFDGAVATLVDDLASTQHDALIDQHLAAYVAGRDAEIDAGRAIDVVSQPDRITFDDLVKNPDVDMFETTVLVPLASYGDALQALEDRLDGLRLPDNRWGRELHDGVAVDVLRARFVHAAYAAVIAHLRGADPSAEVRRAEDALAAATTVITSRDADLHDPHGRRLVDKNTNMTFYQFGYLKMADTLCYWQRELVQVEDILGTSTATPPGCIL